MTAEEFVKSHHPKATIERQVSGRIKGLHEVYYIVRASRKEYFYLSTGKSKSNAWVNAKKFIISKIKSVA